FGDSTLTSDAAEQGVEMVCYAEDVASLLDALGVREPVVLAGFSMGGYVLWQFVRHFADRVRALILCDTRAAADTDEVREGRLRTVEEVRRSGVETVVEAMLPKLLSERTRQE